MPDQYVRLALQSLREADRDLEAPREVEDRLVSALRMGRRRKGTWFSGVRIAQVAAAVVVIAGAVGLAVYKRPVPESVRVELRGPDSRREPTQIAAVSAPGGELRSVAPTRLAAVRQKTTPAREPDEIVTDFYPLLDAAPPLGHAQVLRVVVPARTMRTVGLPVREEALDDRIEADVLVGEEGMARAIRFVRTTGY
jgi:hypothetical protein